MSNLAEDLEIIKKRVGTYDMDTNKFYDSFERVIAEYERLRADHVNDWKLAVDEQLIIAHLGTADSFDSPKSALNALCAFSESVGEYMLKQEIESRLIVAEGFLEGGFYEDSLGQVKKAIALLNKGNENG